MPETLSGPAYIVGPRSRAGHIERPSGSLGSGSWLSIAVRSGRGDQTYCGRPIDSTWQPAPENATPCGTCLRAEFADDED